MSVRIGIFCSVEDEVLLSEWLFLEVIEVLFGVFVDFVVKFVVVFLVGVLKYCFFF